MRQTSNFEKVGDGWPVTQAELALQDLQDLPPLTRDSARWIIT